MRWGGFLMGMVLVGCSRPNPFFGLLSDGAGSDTMDATSETAGSDTSSTTGGVVTSAASSGSETGAVTSVASETGTSTDASTGTSTSTSTSTSAGSSSTGSEGSSGGQPEEDLLYDLWNMCPQAMWNSEGIKIKELSCTVGVPPPAPWAGRLPGFYLFEGVQEKTVLAEVPYPGIGNVVTGKYSGLMLAGESSPMMRAVLVCPGPGTCEITAAVYVEVGGQNVGAFQEVALLSMGQHVQIEVDLAPVNDGTPFDIVMTVESKADAPSSHGLWLRPRVVALL